MSKFQKSFEFIYTKILEYESLLESGNDLEEVLQDCALIKSIISVSIAPGIVDLQRRANLCYPVLLYLT